MADGSLIEAYLQSLQKALGGAAPVAGELMDEVRDHLLSAVESAVAAGVAPLEAERNAIARFGAPEAVVQAWLLKRRRASFGWPALAAFVAIAVVVVLQAVHADAHATRLLQVAVLTAWPLLVLHLGRRWVDRVPAPILFAAVACGFFAACCAVGGAVVNAVHASGGVQAIALGECAAALGAIGCVIWCVQWTQLVWRVPSPAGR